MAATVGKYDNDDNSYNDAAFLLIMSWVHAGFVFAEPTLRTGIMRAGDGARRIEKMTRRTEKLCTVKDVKKLCPPGSTDNGLVRLFGRVSYDCDLQAGECSESILRSPLVCMLHHARGRMHVQTNLMLVSFNVVSPGLVHIIF